MTREEMLDEIREIAKLCGKTPTRRQFLHMSKTKNRYHENWINYNDFLDDAGLAKNKKIRGARATKEEIIAKYKEIWKRDGIEPVYKKFAAECPAEARAMKIYFGFYADMVIAAGGKPRHVRVRKKPWTKEAVLEKMMEDVRNNDIPKKAKEFTRRHHMQYSAITKFFGTYQNLLIQGIGQAINKTKTVAQKKEELPVIPKKDWCKRYPVRYNSSPANLKWFRIRTRTGERCE